MDSWRAMISAQGGDPDAPLPRAEHRDVITADRDGVVTRLDAMGVGVAAWRLGAGRARQGEAVQHQAGVRWHARPGDRVRVGDPLFTLSTRTPERFDGARAALADAVDIDDPRDGVSDLAGPLIIDRVTVGS